MPIWGDPLDELIADLEQSKLGATTPAFELPPRMEDYSIAVLSVISRNPAERLRLAADPATKRVKEYLERLAHERPSTGPVDPTD